jgi:cob(I)alamin adenosyltransferase
MLGKGLVQVYTTPSKRFNFAPIGLTFRAAGQGLRVLIVGFAPHPLMAELPIASSRLAPHLEIDYSALGSPHSALEKGKAAILSGRFDMVVLNGIHDLLSQGGLSLGPLLRMLEEKPSHLELVLTGSNAPGELIERGDLVTSMNFHSREDRPVTDPGEVEVITGHGKGKTTYCLGKAILASCRGVAVRFLQFIKSPRAYGEVKAIRKFPGIAILSMGEGFVNFDSDKPEKRHLNAAQEAWEECLREIFNLDYGMVVMDEINTATAYGLLEPQKVRDLCLLKPANLRLLLSGRNAHPLVAEAANTVLEMEKVKHPFDKGIKGRRGIEF